MWHNIHWTEFQLTSHKVFIKVRVIVDCLGKNLKFFLRLTLKVSCVSFCESDHMSFLVRSDALGGIYKFINFGKRQITHSFAAIFSDSNVGRS